MPHPARQLASEAMAATSADARYINSIFMPIFRTVDDEFDDFDRSFDDELRDYHEDLNALAL